MHPLPTPISDAYRSFALDNQARRFTPKTHEFYRCQLRPFFAWCAGHATVDIAAITPNHIRGFLVALQARGLADTSVNAAARALRAFLNFCVREELLTKSPMAKVAMPRIARRSLPSLDAPSIKRIINACQSDRDRAIVLMLLDTGCRASELINLSEGDVNEDTGAVSIRQGKGRKDRTVYIGAKTRRALLRYYRGRPSAGAHSPLWRNAKTGKPLTTSGLRQLLERIGARAKTPHCAPHAFRRTYAINALRNGMNIYALQRLMGHEDISVLRHYLALLETDLQAASRQHGVVDNLP
jgi:site-specific recombinase XerD